MGAEPENLKRQMFGRDYVNNSYKGGYVDRYDKNGDMDNYMLNSEQAEEILAAIHKDVEEGNFYEHYIYSVPREREEYVNGISLEYTNKNDIYDNWEYFNSYNSYGNESVTITQERAYAASYYRSNYISFGPECVNTVAVLEKLGIVDDKWKLMTSQEYNKLMEEDMLID